MKDVSRGPLRASADTRLLPKLADRLPEQDDRALTMSHEDRRALPSAADSTRWNARGGNQPGSESGSERLVLRRFEGDPRQTTALPAPRSTAP
jgi:hypothetical protein